MILSRFQDAFKEAGTSDYMYPSEASVRLNYNNYIDKMMEDLSDQMYRKYVQKDKRNEAKVNRPSVLGKLYDFDALYSQINMFDKSRLMSEKLNLIFSIGNFFEAWVIFTLKRMGYSVKTNVEVIRGDLEGHIDIIVTDDDGEDYIIEVKTASSTYFDRILRDGIDDSRGYLTQAACYQNMMGLPLYWLFVNKDTCDLLLVPLNEVVPEDIIQSRYERAHKLSSTIITELKDVFYHAEPPAPSIEKDRYGNHKLDELGNPKLYVPYDCLYPDIYYRLEEGKTSYGKKRNYVVGVKRLFGELVDEDLADFAIQADLEKSEFSYRLSSQFKTWLSS